MRISRRTLLLCLLTALSLPGLPAAVAAAPSPTLSLTPGRYSGTVNMTIMHNGSASGGGISTAWSIDMVASLGKIDINILPLGTLVVGVEMPVPIDHHSTASISDEASKCKGYSVISSAYGTASGLDDSRGEQTTDRFIVHGMDFDLIPFLPRVKTKGECPSENWRAKAREAIESDFAAIFGSEWRFTIFIARPASMAGRCESATFGKAKGEMLTCGWRVFPVASE